MTTLSAYKSAFFLGAALFASSLAAGALAEDGTAGVPATETHDAGDAHHGDATGGDATAGAPTQDGIVTPAAPVGTDEEGTVEDEDSHDEE
ncbi:MAG: hypothetical protein ABW189_00480 [Rickettsiales bacterium]